MKKLAQFNRGGMLAIAASALGQTFEVETDREVERAGNVVIVDIRDVLLSRSHEVFDDYESIKCRVFEAMGMASKVILRIDSPGGEVYGCFEASKAIRAEAIRRGVKLVAFVDGVCASAAFALACAADTIVIPPSGIAGSVGVINQLSSRVAADRAMGIEYLIIASGAHKADGNPHVIITDAIKADQQEQVDSLASQFFEIVSEARGMNPDAVKALEARVFYGANAVAQGLCDQVSTFDELLVMVTSLNGWATAGPKVQIMKYADLLAALNEMAEGDDDDADKAKELLKMMSDDKPDGDEPDAEDEVPPAKDPDAADDKPEPEAEDDAPAPADPADKKAAAKASFDLVKAYATLAAKVERLATKDERRTLLASRPDLVRDSKMKAWLETAPLATVRNAIKAIPKATSNKVATAAAALQPGVKATRGSTQGNERAPQLPPEERKEMDARMGLSQKPAAVTRVGNTQFFSVGNGKAQKSAN